MDPLRLELDKGIFQLSNHEKMVVSAVTNLSNLLTMWDKQDLMGRKLLVKTLYPKGIVVDREKHFIEPKIEMYLLSIFKI